MTYHTLPRARSALPLHGQLRGSVTLELAFALPLLMAALLAIVDFGGYYNDRLLLSSAAYNGAKARAAAPACGVDLGQVGHVVHATAVTDPTAIVITQHANGGGQLRRYTVSLSYPRPQGTLSLFTQSIEGLATIQVTALALCDPDCNSCI